MSVLIKGMEMPKTCIMCWLSPVCPVWVKEVSRYKGYDNRLPDCPLVEVPPHGRLIDAEALYERTAEWEAQALAQVEKHDPLVENQTRGWAHWSVVLVERTAFKYDIADAPTIIEAEEGRG